MFGGMKAGEKMKNLHFTGRRMKKSESPVYKGREVCKFPVPFA
jgi:hypothetical protein